MKNPYDEFKNLGPTDLPSLRNFGLREIKNCVKKDISEIKAYVMYQLQELRDEYDKYLKSKGLDKKGFKPNFYLIDATRGEHSKNSVHPYGIAIDFSVGFPYEVDDVIRTILGLAVRVGFNGIGVYKNEYSIYSFHVDIREEMEWWKAVKDENGKWAYSNIDIIP